MYRQHHRSLDLPWLAEWGRVADGFLLVSPMLGCIWEAFSSPRASRGLTPWSTAPVVLLFGMRGYRGGRLLSVEASQVNGWKGNPVHRDPLQRAKSTVQCASWNIPRQMWPWAEEQGTLRVLNTWQQIPKPKRRLKCKSGTQGFSQKHIKTRHMPACSFTQSALEFMFPGLSPQGQLLQPCTPSSPEMRGN